MAKPRQSSFRRTLLARILLLSIPVLLTGELVAYRKARGSLVEMARQSLTESAARKTENIHNLIEALQLNVITASAALTPQLELPRLTGRFINQIQGSLSSKVQCIQLTNWQTRRIEASTCGTGPIAAVAPNTWKEQNSNLMGSPSPVLVAPARVFLPQGNQTLPTLLNLVLSAPVYDRTGKLRYVLSVQVALPQSATNQARSLSSYTVVIDQKGQILAHPEKQQIGQNIRQVIEDHTWEEIATTARSGSPATSPTLMFSDNGAEWLAGYHPLMIPTGSEPQTWIVLAVAPLDNALYGLEEIKQVLLILTLGLIAANLLATIYVTRDLALPLEQLGSYALRIDQRQSPERAPKNFKIKEINQLAVALDNMVERLQERAEELETAWQEAQVANQLKSEFLATTSHELRTPLNAIIGCVRLVRDGCCDSREEELEFLQQADDAAIHLLKIINDLLDIAKIEAGKVELNLQPISIQDLCDQCLRMIQPGAEKKHIDLSLEVNAGLNRVLLDERRVRQMVINLLSNAVKFTREGGQVKLKGWLGYGHQLEQDIRPDHSPVNPETPYLCLEVTDSGIGIPKERWHLLFRPFQQIDSSLARKHEGTGLGLALTKRLAELHGGTVSFRSAPGKGSVFRIWLPSREPQTSGGSVPVTDAATEDNSPDLPGPLRDKSSHSASSFG